MSVQRGKLAGVKRGEKEWEEYDNRAVVPLSKIRSPSLVLFRWFKQISQKLLKKRYLLPTVMAWPMSQIKKQDGGLVNRLISLALC